MNPATDAAALADEVGPPKDRGFFARHPVGFWYIFSGELAERSSYYGMRAILALYMTEKLGFTDGQASVTMSYFIAACYLLPLVGGYLADNVFGKYWTIVGFSLPYILGHVILGVESRPYLYTALALLAMGSGVIKPNISTLMGMTYDQQRPGLEKLRSDAFAMFYWAINVGAALSAFTMPVLRTRFGYAVAFLFPAGLMVIAFLVFAMGKRHYAVEVISRKESTPEVKRQRLEVLGRIVGLFLVVTFFWSIFDQAASTWTLFTRDLLDLRLFGVQLEPDMIQGFNPILIILLLPPVTALWKVFAGRGRGLRATDKMLIGFVLTAAAMAVMSAAGNGSLANVARYAKDGYTIVLLGDGGQNRILRDGPVTAGKAVVVETVEDVRALKVADPAKVAYLTQVGNPDLKRQVGEKGSSHPYVDDVKGALLERFPAAVVPAKVPVIWEILAYVIITVAEICISVSGLELAFTAAPPNMKSFVTACWLLTVFIGNILNAQLTPYYEAMLPDRYFGMLAVMMIPVTVVFYVVGRRFNRAAANWKAEAPPVELA